MEGTPLPFGLSDDIVGLIDVLGGITSMVGVLIALVGFVITIWNVMKSKEAAKRAESAANETLGRVRYVDTLQNLTKAISTVEEIQKLNRTKDWNFLLDRHQEFRRVLTEIRGSTPSLTDDQKGIIQSGVTHSRSMSNKIEIALDKGNQPTGVPQMNKVLSEQLEGLTNILAEMRTETDG